MKDKTEQTMKGLNCGCATYHLVRVGATIFCGWHGWVKVVR